MAGPRPHGAECVQSTELCLDRLTQHGKTGKKERDERMEGKLEQRQEKRESRYTGEMIGRNEETEGRQTDRPSVCSPSGCAFVRLIRALLGFWDTGSLRAVF